MVESSASAAHKGAFPRPASFGSPPQVPPDVGFFNLNWHERTLPCAGLDLRPELHGIVAVEPWWRNERGRLPDPRKAMFSGRWVAGPTLRSTAHV